MSNPFGRLDREVEAPVVVTRRRCQEFELGEDLEAIRRPERPFDDGVRHDAGVPRAAIADAAPTGWGPPRPGPRPPPVPLPPPVHPPAHRARRPGGMAPP